MERYIDFPSTSKDWKKFELNNEIALYIFTYFIILKKYTLLINQNII